MKDRNLTKVELLAAIAGIFLFIAILPRIDPARNLRQQPILCRAKLKEIGTLLKLYANDHEGKYPTPENWCDILLEKYAEGKKEVFLCRLQSEGNYALNPSCTANSPKDVVLVFECIGGWNAFGGPEIQAFANQKAGGGCNVLFNSGKVKSMGPQDKLKWGTEGTGGEQKSKEAER